MVLLSNVSVINLILTGEIKNSYISISHQSKTPPKKTDSVGTSSAGHSILESFAEGKSCIP